MTSTVYCGHRATNQTNNNNKYNLTGLSFLFNDQEHLLLYRKIDKIVTHLNSDVAQKKDFFSEISMCETRRINRFIQYTGRFKHHQNICLMTLEVTFTLYFDLIQFVILHDII